MNQIFKIIVIIAGLFLLGCSSNNNKSKPLELTILNKEFYAYCPFENCNSGEAYADGNLEKYRNIVSFKIINHSDSNYILIPFCIENALGCTTFFQFPKSNSGLSLNNLIFYSSKDTTSYSNNLLGGMSEYHWQTENVVSFFQKSMNKKTENINMIHPMFVNENMLILPANSTVYYKSFFSLPFNKTSLYSAHEVMLIEKRKNYNIALIFKSSKIDVLKYLNEGAKKTLEQDNFKLFDGELISTNQVPLIIKEN